MVKRDAKAEKAHHARQMFNYLNSQTVKRQLLTPKPPYQIAASDLKGWK